MTAVPKLMMMSLSPDAEDTLDEVLHGISFSTPFQVE